MSKEIPIPEVTEAAERYYTEVGSPSVIAAFIEGAHWAYRQLHTQSAHAASLECPSCGTLFEDGKWLTRFPPSLSRSPREVEKPTHICTKDPNPHYCIDMAQNGTCPFVKGVEKEEDDFFCQSEFGGGERCASICDDCGKKELQEQLDMAREAGMSQSDWDEQQAVKSIPVEKEEEKKDEGVVTGDEWLKAFYAKHPNHDAEKAKRDEALKFRFTDQQVAEHISEIHTPLPEKSLPIEEKEVRKSGEGWKAYAKLPVAIKDQLFSFLESYIFLDGGGRDVVFDADAMMAMHDYSNAQLSSANARIADLEKILQEKQEWIDSHA